MHLLSFYFVLMRLCPSSFKELSFLCVYFNLSKNSWIHQSVNCPFSCVIILFSSIGCCSTASNVHTSSLLVPVSHTSFLPHLPNNWLPFVCFSYLHKTKSNSSLLTHFFKLGFCKLTMYSVDWVSNSNTNSDPRSFSPFLLFQRQSLSMSSFYMYFHISVSFNISKYHNGITSSFLRFEYNLLTSYYEKQKFIFLLTIHLQKHKQTSVSSFSQ